MGASPFMPNPFSMMPPTMAPMGAMAPTMMDPMAMMSCGMSIPGITHKGDDKAPLSMDLTYPQYFQLMNMSHQY